MRKVEGSNNYLKNQVRKYLGRAILSLLFFGLIFVLTVYRFIFQTQVIGVIEVVGFVMSLVMLVVFRYYQRKYYIYKGGRRGERAVVNELAGSLNDEYCLINGAYLKGGGGDIDHIVLGPNGVYVLETKNWSGKTVCNGDQWQRPGKKVVGNPSLQVKYNVQKVKRLIGMSPVFRGCEVWVEGLIVFTNTYADLSINNSTVTVLRLQQLSKYIKSHEGNGVTREQIQHMVKQIQNA
ncbi:MAG: NERD domain-containing protein [Candidatus Bathyarchaeota archaeon]|nr:NERD domain-containing protein [Candidatus Termiticorpusculum sp.]